MVGVVFGDRPGHGKQLVGLRLEQTDALLLNDDVAGMHPVAAEIHAGTQALAERPGGVIIKIGLPAHRRMQLQGEELALAGAFAKCKLADRLPGDVPVDVVVGRQVIGPRGQPEVAQAGPDRGQAALDTVGIEDHE